MATQLKDENEIKIFILYLLDKIGYPLDYPSIGSIMVQDGIVNFFDFAQCFFSLVDAGHIREIISDKRAAKILEITPDSEEEEGLVDDPVLYEVTETGRHVAEALSGNLMVTVREKSYRSALRHLDFEKSGVKVNRSYKPDGDGYMVHCTISGRDGLMMDLKIKADSEYQLNSMLKNYDDKPEVVLRGIIALLSGDVNYLFES